MNKFKNTLLIALTAMISVVFLNGCTVKNSGQEFFNEIFCSVSQPQNPAQQLFTETWNAIDEEYYDRKFNNQQWLKWKKRYLNNIKTMDDAYVAIDTMVESLDDPYTRFLRPDEFKEQNMSIDAKLYGIGVNIVSLKGQTVVVNVIDETPAQKSGFKAGDIITKVNATPIDGLPLKKVAEMVRGKAGTTVVLTIQRDKKKIVKNIVRKKIELKSVEYKPLENDMAYIKISNFISQDASFEVMQALEKSKEAKGLIIDLRGNHGGLLPNALLIANMFINKGKIVSIVDKDGRTEDIMAGDFQFYTDKPVVVLINGASASASEILSGALKDHKRALLVGEKTYGKGLVQKIHPLPNDAGINITVAKYLTPNGTDINKKGIAPDYKVEVKEKDFFSNKDPQLDKAKQVLKQELKSYLYAAS